MRISSKSGIGLGIQNRANSKQHPNFGEHCLGKGDENFIGLVNQEAITGKRMNPVTGVQITTAASDWKLSVGSCKAQLQPASSKKAIPASRDFMGMHPTKGASLRQPYPCLET